jgi:hypothetical protein
VFFPDGQAIHYGGITCSDCDISVTVSARSRQRRAGETTWRDLSFQAPGARRSHTLTYSTARARAVLFGGTTSTGTGTSGVRSDTWFLTAPSTWKRLAPASSPPARGNHASVYDRKGGRVLIAGGVNGSTRHRDLWALDDDQDTWTSLGTLLPVGGSVSLAIDPATDDVLVLDSDGALYRLVDDVHPPRRWPAVALDAALDGAAGVPGFLAVATPLSARVVAQQGLGTPAPLWSLDVGADLALTERALDNDGALVLDDAERLLGHILEDPAPRLTFLVRAAAPSQAPVTPSVLRATVHLRYQLAAP